MPNEIALEMLNKTLSGEGLNIKPNLNCGSPVWNRRLFHCYTFQSHYCVLKCRITELPLRAGLIHAL